MTGTSMATPHIAGAVALIEELRREVSGTGWDTAGRAEEAVLTSHVVDLGDEGPDDVYGAGLPQLLGVYDQLTLHRPNVTVDLALSSETVRVGENLTLTLAVTNEEPEAIEGTLEAHLVGAGGEPLALGALPIVVPGHGAVLVEQDHAFGMDALAGPHTVRAVFRFDWMPDDSEGSVPWQVADEAIVELQRPFASFRLDGLAGTAVLLEEQRWHGAVSNTGNEPMTGLAYGLRIPTSYAILPPDEWDPLAFNGIWASPPPDDVRLQPVTGAITLTWNVSVLAVGDAFEVAVKVMPIEPGTQVTRSLADYKDGIGQELEQTLRHSQEVGPS